MSQCNNRREACPCPKENCERKGNCCQCVAFHRDKGNLPSCLRKCS